jgi:two-component system, cell cycle sensor histidine kinase and response regulator CckA
VNQGTFNMRKIGILSVLAAAFLSLSFFNCAKSLISNKTAPRAENGVLDLSAWSLKNDGPVALDGKWEFYWNTHLKPDDFSSETPPKKNGFIEVPGTWNGYEINGKKIDGEGYATYRLKIHLANSGQILAFKLLDMATSFSVYLDGKKLMSAGVPGKTPQSTKPRFFPQVVEFKPVFEQLEVVILVSNFHHHKGGAWEPILLGLSADIRQIRQRALNLNFFLFGGILMMGLYHMSLFIIRAKEKSILYFGIFCFLIAIRSLVTGERCLIGLFPDFSWEIYTKIAYLTFYIAAPVFAMYFRYIFPKEISRYVISLVIIVSALFSGIVLFTPAKIYTHMIPIFQIFTVVVSCYGFYALILALVRKRRGAGVCLAGFAVLFLTIVNDMLYANLLIQTGYIIQFGLFIFIFFQAFLLSVRFSKAFETVELQHRTLEDTNAAYKKEIRERKRTAEALRESEEKYRLLVQNASDAIVVARDGMLCFVNSRAIALSGYTEEELLSKPFIAVVHPQDRDTVQSNYLKKLSGKPVPMGYTFRCLHKDGGIKWVEPSAVRISWEGAPATLNFLRDITEKHRLEEELLKAQKLEAIGVLAGGIAHDFNNILAAIMGNVSLAKMDVNQNDKIHHILEEAEEASKRAKALTRQLLTFSKGGAPVKEVTTISDVIVGCSNFALSGSRIGCDFNLPADLWPVKIDVGQINQVIQNIIINADQAMHAGGTIRISAANITVNMNHGLPLQPGNYVLLTFQDSGSGISEANLKKIFDPYFTSKENGSGLGLTTAYSIIKKHDGHITVDSQVGVGTTFNVYLPSSKEEIRKKTKDARVDIQGKGKILAMDDEEMIRSLIQEMLHRMGYEVELANDGEEAIGLYRRAIEAGRPFDAVILDLTVPGAMGGKEAIGKLCEIDKNVKAVVSSGYSIDPVMSNYEEYGFCGVVEKPYNLQKLGETLNQILKL